MSDSKPALHPQFNKRNPWSRPAYGRYVWVTLFLLGLPSVVNHDLPMPGKKEQTQITARQAPVQPAAKTGSGRPVAEPQEAHAPKPRPGPKADTEQKPAPKAKTAPAVETGNSNPLSHWCSTVAGRLFSVSLRDCQNRGFADTGYRSVKGRMIAVRDVDAGKSPHLGRVLLVGGTHGDELTSVSIVFWWLDMLDKQPSAITWRVAPLMNPDGMFARPPQRVNAHNVDLNRNLPTPDWKQASRAYWQEVGRAPRRYPGSTPASEPETRWLIHEVRSFKPSVIVSIHAPYGVLDYDGNYPPPERLGDLSLHKLGVYPGSLGNYGSRYLGIPVITVELNNATSMPSRKRARAMWDDLNVWLNQYLRHKQEVELDKNKAKS